MLKVAMALPKHGKFGIHEKKVRELVYILLFSFDQIQKILVFLK